MDKEDVIQTHTHTQWNIRHKKNEILPFAAAGMDLEIVQLSELSQTKTNTLCYHLYGESKNGAN